jgi:hypothetical protein
MEAITASGTRSFDMDFLVALGFILAAVAVIFWIINLANIFRGRSLLPMKVSKQGDSKRRMDHARMHR